MNTPWVTMAGVDANGAAGEVTQSTHCQRDS